MRAESNDGGLRLDNETADTEKGAPTRRRKVLVAVVVLMIVLVSIGILAVLLRPWKITEIGEKVVGPPGAPGFQTDLAGKTVVVAGEVTNMSCYETTLGPITFIELDGFELLHLVEWKEPTFKVGDTISREVLFEWSQINDQVRVMSPQLDFPGLVTIPSLGGVTAAVSCIAGICPIEKNDESSDSAIIEIVPYRGEGFPLGLFNASLRKGVYSWATEYISLMSGYEDNPEIDYIDSLEVGIGENETLEFVDANSNGLLDDGDYFKANLTRPTADSAILTYLLQIGDGPYFDGISVLEGMSYIVVTNRGVLRYTGVIVPGGPFSISPDPHAKTELRSETETNGNITAEIVVSSIGGPLLEIQDGDCWLSKEVTVLECGPLREGEVATQGNYSVSFSDSDGDGYLSVGDIFALSGLSNWTSYTFYLKSPNGTMYSTKWTTGIGYTTGNLPVIDWEEPMPLDPPLNHTFKLQIERMYGVPGVHLGDLEERMVADVKRDGLFILTSANLTEDFNITLPTLNITFEDADGNGFVNTGDFFLCTSSGSAEFEIFLNYVNTHRYWRLEQPLISWPISWITG